MFKTMAVNKYPPRQWALVGYPGSGKSTFAAQMQGPLLVVDADHRFGEVAGLATGNVYQMSDDPADNVNAERIAGLLKANMAGAGVKTVVIDSLTAILSPLVVEAILSNDAGANKNRVAAFKDKALAMRLLQDAITGWGVHTLWIYHYRQGLDAKAQQAEATSISLVELTRLRRSLNLQLSVVERGGRRGVKVDWARRGRAGQTLWDETGVWHGMPERIEAAVYDGLSLAEQDSLVHLAPASFSGPADAIAWGFEQGAFDDALHAQNAYEKVKREGAPATAAAMWPLWVADVQRRLVERETTPAAMVETF